MTERGQAAVELLGGLPLVLGLGLAMCQVLAAGYSALLAGNAAEAGALALAARADARASARDALPGWSRARAHVRVRGGSVTVRVRPPALLPGAGRALETTSTASIAR